MLNQLQWQGRLCFCPHNLQLSLHRRKQMTGCNPIINRSFARRTVSRWQIFLCHIGSKNFEHFSSTNSSLVWADPAFHAIVTKLTCCIALACSCQNGNLRAVSEISCSVIGNHADMKYAQDQPSSTIPLRTFDGPCMISKIIKATSTVSYKLSSSATY